MGVVSLFIIFSSILAFAHNIHGCYGYDSNQGKLDFASLGGEIDGLPHVGPLTSIIENGSHTIQQSNDKGAPQPDAGATYFYIATHMMNSKSYYGIEVTSDVYGFIVDEDEWSGMFLQINNIGDQTKWRHNAINVGCHVNPGLYRDSKTHFYVHWTSDGYGATGCYNLWCPGYMIDANANITPAQVIDTNPNGVKRTITIKLVMGSVGDWLVYVGIDSRPSLIGRYPKSLFTGLGDKADTIRLGGFVVTHTTKMAPMGSGFLPNNTKAASFSNIQLINQNGKISKVQEDQHVFMNNKNIYSASPISYEGNFTYGGPIE